jgi:hypothetical protein
MLSGVIQRPQRDFNLKVDKKLLSEEVGEQGRCWRKEPIDLGLRDRGALCLTRRNNNRALWRNNLRSLSTKPQPCGVEIYAPVD